MEAVECGERPRGVPAHLDGTNVFQCFWSDPQTRVFGQTPKHVFLIVFGSASSPPSPRVIFNVLGIVQKHVFFTAFLRLCTVFAI